MSTSNSFFSRSRLSLWSRAKQVSCRDRLVIYWNTLESGLSYNSWFACAFINSSGVNIFEIMLSLIVTCILARSRSLPCSYVISSSRITWQFFVIPQLLRRIRCNLKVQAYLDYSIPVTGFTLVITTWESSLLVRHNLISCLRFSSGNAEAGLIVELFWVATPLTMPSATEEKTVFSF